MCYQVVFSAAFNVLLYLYFSYSISYFIIDAKYCVKEGYSHFRGSYGIMQKFILVLLELLHSLYFVYLITRLELPF